MIRQKTIYLKNLILFKLVIYPIILIFYYSLSIMLQQKLKTLNIHNRRASEELKILQIRYQATTDLLSNTSLVSKLDAITASQINLWKLSNKCSEIGSKHKIAGLKVHFTSPYPAAPMIYSNKFMSIYSNDIIIKFCAKDFKSSLLFVEQYCSILPQYSFIESLEIYSCRLDDSKNMNIAEYPIVATLRIQVEHIEPITKSINYNFAYN